MRKNEANDNYERKRFCVGLLAEGKNVSYISGLDIEFLKGSNKNVEFGRVKKKDTMKDIFG